MPIGLYDALYRMKSDNVPDHNFEFMITFDRVERKIVFGKKWTKNSASNFGTNTPVYWIHQENCQTFVYENEDMFLSDLFKDSVMHIYFGEIKFHVWEEVK